MESRSPALRADSLLSEPPGKPVNTRVGSLSLLQGIFLTQESNQGLLHCKQILYQLNYQGKLMFLRYNWLTTLWEFLVHNTVILYFCTLRNGHYSKSSYDVTIWRYYRIIDYSPRCVLPTCDIYLLAASLYLFIPLTYYSLQYFLPSGKDDLFVLCTSDLVSVSLCGFICLVF